MICKKCLVKERADLPRFIAEAINAGDYEEVLSLQHTQRTLEWVLSEDDCRKRRKRND